MRASDSQVRKDSRVFEELCSALLRRGNAVQFTVRGQSMQPNLQDGDDVVVVPARPEEIQKSDVVLAENSDGLRVHRVISRDTESGNFILRSDAGLENDPSCTRVLGKVHAVRRESREEILTPFQTQFVHPLRRISRRIRAAAALRLRRLGSLLPLILGLAVVWSCLAVPAVHAQDADLQLTQTAVALGTTTPAITALAAGTTYSYLEVVKNNTTTVNVAANAIVVYMQTPPNTTYQGYATGAGWTCTHPNVGAIGPVICTYGNALAGGATATTLTVDFQVAPWAASTAYAVGTRIVDSNGNIEQVVTAGTSGTGSPTWTTTLGGQTTDNTVVWQNAGTAAGTTIQNSATVTTSGTNAVVDPTPSNNTSLTSVVIEPTTTSDLAVSMSVAPTPVFVSSTLTYTILVQNLGQAAAPATTGVLSDTLPGSVGYVSYTASAGWSCPTVPAVGSSGPVTCGITSAMAMGSTATITITVTAPATAQTLTNKATATLTGDPNSSNNTASAITVVQPLACATPGRDGSPGAISGVVNTYYPPANAGTLAAGTTSVALGTAQGNTGKPIAAGDLVLIIQMQGAAINTTNTSSYGHGVPGDPATGWTSLGSTGLFEFVTATGFGGTTLTFTGTGPTGGLLNSYSYEPSTAALGKATAASWAGNVASFTFTGLPTSLAAGNLITTTGFAPAGYNLTGTILSVNSGTGVVTVSLTTNPGGETTLGTGSANLQAQQTYQVIRVPQYASATLSSTLAPLAWNGSLGGVLAIDVASQLTLGGTVVLDGLGFRGAGGRVLGGGTGAPTDYVTLATDATNAGKGEGIAGTPRYLAPATITSTTTATDTTGGNPGDTMPSGSYARGAPGNAGGGGTDGNPAANNENSGGGAGGNGGAGGQGGYGWDSMAATNSTDGGFGGAAFPASTSALVMGGGGGGGTTNDGSYYIPSSGTGGADCGANCTGIYSSGGAGGGIVIIHTGSVYGTGTITSNGLSTLSTENDSTGGAGAGGSILVFANSGGVGGLTADANGGNGGDAWPEEGPGTPFPGQRHGPGGGGGGGVIFLTGSPANYSVNGGANGYTDTVQDSYGSTPGQNGLFVNTEVITETPGTQSGAYCASADLSATNSASPTVVAPGGTIVYTQTVTNNGPNFDAVNVVFSEGIPANTTYQTMTYPAGWTCTTPPTYSTITCTDPDLANGGSGTFTVTVQVNSATLNGTQIIDVDNVTSGTTDPNLSNNTATAVVLVSATGQADLAVVNTASASTVTVGSQFSMSAAVTNNGPSAASTLVFTEPTASNAAGTVNATFYSISAPGWNCTTPVVGATGTITCTLASLNAGTSAGTIMITETAPSATAGTVLSATANIASSTPDPNYNNNVSTASIEIATSGQADLAVTDSGAPNPVASGGKITYSQTIANLGPTSITASASTTVTFTDTISLIYNGTTQVGTTTLAATFTPPTGWSCNTIAVGGTGTFTCNLVSGNTFTAGASLPFTLSVNVPSSTASGLTVVNTLGISSSVSDPNSANNLATVSTPVASPTQAYLTITKMASPEPVTMGNTLTYTITVQNAGPAPAQNVVVTDAIQSQVSYVSASSTMGSCTYAAPTVTCNLTNASTPTLGVGSVAVITISVTANIFSSTGVTCPGYTSQVGSCNTATVTTTTSNANPTNSSSVGSTIQAPSAVDFSSFHAFQQADGTVRLVWRTVEESRNLGFHVYREDGSGRQRVDAALIAGSALLMRGFKPQHAAKTYAAIDSHPAPNAAYWIEDVDINGSRTLHGPAYIESPSADQAASLGQKVSPSLAQLHAGASVGGVQFRPIVRPGPLPPPPPVGVQSYNLADHAAVQISVTQEGWYHIPFVQLFSAGLNPVTDVRLLHLYAEGTEQPILLIGHTAGIASPTDALEFYGTGIDTPFSETRVYWLVAENTPGERIPATNGASSGAIGAGSFPFTTVLEDHTIYLAALLNGENNDNFFGAVVTTDPVDQTLNVVHRDTTSTAPLTMDIALQGVVDQQPHAVIVQFNGSTVGAMNFYGQALFTQTFSIDPSIVLDGTNTVTLTALDGDNDVSAVQSIQLHYLHTYTADSDWLEATAQPGTQVQIGGFVNAQVRVFDISNALSISEIRGAVTPVSGAYRVTVDLPGNSAGPRTLLAFSNDVLSSPSAVSQYVPALGDQNRTGADIIMIAYPEFASHVAPLVQLRESQGYRVMLVTTDQIYDQYNYGEHSPFAIRSYLQDAATNWQRKPQAVLLVGDASLDPNNYLGFGYLDFVPTRIIQTAALKTASDDWITDFQQTGYATIPTGRLPARTTADVDLLVSKIIGYEQGAFSGSWNTQALLIADQNVDSNFTAATTSAAATLPSSLETTELLTDGLDQTTAHSEIVAALNNGALLVDYNGHGAEQQWSFADIFDNNDAAALTNGGRLPVYLLIDCLNGLFQDVYAQSLAEAILLSPNGGGVAVWASSGFTSAPPQAAMDLALLHQFTAHPNYPLGRMILNAKAVTSDNDVRRTWVLFGDPSLKFQFTGSTTNVVSGSAPVPGVPSGSPRACPRGSSCAREIQ